MESQKFTGVKYKGQSFDCGSKIGFLTANVVFALDRPDIAEGFQRELQAIDYQLKRPYQGRVKRNPASMALVRLPPPSSYLRLPHSDIRHMPKRSY